MQIPYLTESLLSGERVEAADIGHAGRHVEPMGHRSMVPGLERCRIRPAAHRLGECSVQQGGPDVRPARTR